MTFKNIEKGNKKYYEEIMYISSNYYIFKKRPRTKTHSLIKAFILYILLFLILLFSFSFIPNMMIMIGVCLTCVIVYTYLLIETNYKLREFMKHNNSLIKIDETGIEKKEENITSSKLYWKAIEYIIINKHSICVLSKNFAHFAIFIEISSKEEVLKALEKYNKTNLLIDNSNKYK